MSSLVFNAELFEPKKIVCIGRNYVEHIKELNNDVPDDMVVFNKPASCISDELLSHHEEPLHYETELCFIIQQQKLAGVGIGFDLTKRQLQSTLKAKGLPWERAKAFDGAATFSYFVPLNHPIESLSFTLHIDNTLTQQGDTSLMMVSPEAILTQLATFMRLEDRDVLMTGTPKGVGIVKAGSQYTARVFAGHQQLIEHTWIGK
jgi:2-keto-4-pentenoate hydratase/2-oxohepta-3-ene-1,7-dioic acid hydratase in catechol pathway